MIGVFLVIFTLAQPQQPLADAHADLAEKLRTRVHRIADAVAAGYKRSSTFRRLVDELRVAGAVVYIDAGRCRPNAPQATNGCLALLARTEAVSLFRIIVDIGLAKDRLIALLGHELQHAVEIVTAPPAPPDGDAVARNAERASNGIYETEAARAVTRRILDELRRRR